METPISEIPDSDWELVASPSSDQTHHSSSGGGGGVIQSDYFSLESNLNYTATSPDDADGGESDKPSWVDPIDISVVGGNKGKRSRSRISSCSSYPSSSDSVDHDLLEIVENDSGRNDVEVNSVVESSGKDGVDEQFEGNEEEKEERVVWWKVPMEVLKCWVMRVRPVWSLSMVAAAAAAALVGFVVLRRRYLEKVKRKSLGIRRNVIVDDKMVFQIMSQVVRLNKAFSVVKRVPILRPALPAPGMGPWPVMCLR